MRIAILSLVLFFVLSAILFTTKPSRDDFDQELTSILREAITSTSYGDGGLLSNMTMLGCKLRSGDCLTILKSLYTVSNNNYVLVTRHRVSGPGASIDCWGILKQFVCESKVSIPTVANALNSLW